MKICDATQAYNRTSGGIKTYIHEKRRYLTTRTDWEHILIVPGEEDRCITGDRTRTYEIASPFIPGCEPYRIILNLEAVTGILERECPDIIELGSAYTLPWAVFKHAERFPCVVAAYYHTDFPTAYVETTVKRFLGARTAKLAKAVVMKYAGLVYGKCDFVMVPSTMLIRNLSRCRISHIEHVPLGIDTNQYSPAHRDMAIRRRLGISDEEFMLVYMGRLDAEKHIDTLVNAYNLLRIELPSSFLIIGNGPRYKDINSRKEAYPGLKLMSYTSDKQELAGLLASADLYITAGPHETFGLSVLEAQSSGLPVVGVNAGALPERVPDEVGALCPVDDYRAMADIIKHICRNGIRQMGVNARRMVEENYSWERTFKRIFDLYEHYRKTPGICN